MESLAQSPILCIPSNLKIQHIKNENKTKYRNIKKPYIFILKLYINPRVFFLFAPRHKYFLDLIMRTEDCSIAGQR